MYQMKHTQIRSLINKSKAQEQHLYDDEGKYSLWPIPEKYIPIYEAYQDQISKIWFPNEIDYDNDKADWNQLTHDERQFIKYIIGFFALADGIVIENLIDNFLKELTNPYIRLFYHAQTVMEEIHAITYNIMLEEYVTDEVERKYLQNSIENVPIIKNKAEWAQKWMSSQIPIAQRIIAFACVEGLFFYGPFHTFYWLRERNKLPGAVKANKFIEEDERKHRNFAVLLLNNYVTHRPDKMTAHEIITSACEMEIEFICGAMPNTLNGLNAKDMGDSIKWLANNLSKDMGYGVIENYKDVRNNLEFTRRRNYEVKENFFERTVTQYKKSNSEVSFNFLEEF